MRVRTKICGITRIEDALVAVGAGVDALGFVFYRGSPRYITPEAARSIIDRLPPFVTAVGLFVDAAQAEVRHAAALAGVSVLQFQGDEDASACEAAGLPYIKAVPVAGELDVTALQRAHPRACAFQLDAHVDGRKGGTGQTFDWALWPRESTVPLVLAGGLRPDNVALAIAATRPYAVDVSGGVEADRPGQKDREKIVRFVSEVLRAGQGL